MASLTYHTRLRGKGVEQCIHFSTQTTKFLIDGFALANLEKITNVFFMLHIKSMVLFTVFAIDILVIYFVIDDSYRPPSFRNVNTK